jgi:hypothetical protein
MPLTNPPFTRDPKKPPIYLRDLEPEEVDQYRRMRDKAEAHLRKRKSEDLQRLETL